ncbi:MAG: Ku protein [Phycisphaerales bacterium]|nr:Ku protein [Phycisphaerae bacterium]NNF43351.1 Ku protein [Phycisphaerales bacterium]NNM24565.1 Ku protein [Phycisphaerales bacterium]
MPPRATWKGHLKLSLVSFGVRLYNATSSASRISLNQLHKDCNQRLRQKMHCPSHGEVDRAEIVKGYEFEKGRYVVVEPDDLEKIQIETTKTIEITQFIDRDELRPVYRNAPYYVAPDGAVAEEAFRVVRVALERAGKIGIGQFVLAGREHVIAIEPDGRGLRMTTIRASNEVRAGEPYFEEITDGELDADHLKLAEELIKSKTAPLDTSIFRDRYQDAMLEIIKAKIEGKEPVVIEEDEAAPSLNFMDALKASVAEATGKKKSVRKKPPAKSVKKAAGKTRKKA